MSTVEFKDESTTVDKGDLRGANCVGLHQLFDSTHAADHLIARALCKTCPALLACQRRLDDALLSTPPGQPGPCGTWAGRMVAVRPGGRRPAECGTDSGYVKHRRDGQEACLPCKAAHAAAHRERVA